MVGADIFKEVGSEPRSVTKDAFNGGNLFDAVQGGSDYHGPVGRLLVPPVL